MCVSVEERANLCVCVSNGHEKLLTDGMGAKSDHLIQFPRFVFHVYILIFFRIAVTLHF